MCTIVFDHGYIFGYTYKGIYNYWLYIMCDNEITHDIWTSMTHSYIVTSTLHDICMISAWIIHDGLSNRYADITGNWNTPILYIHGPAEYY